MSKKRDELRRLNGIYGNILGKADVEMIEGRAKLLDAHTVQVGERKYTAKHICIAVGGTPKMLGLPGARQVARLRCGTLRIVTSCPTLPSRHVPAHVPDETDNL